MGKKAKGDGVETKSSKKKLLMVGLLLVGVIGGVMAARMMGGTATAAGGPTTTTPPVPGEVAEVEAMNINLMGGHYLRIGIAVQLAEGPVAEEWLLEKGPLVRDEVIAVFAGRDADSLGTAEGRTAATEELLAALHQDEADDAEEGAPGAPSSEILDLYLTDFVMQ
jgi:flagellar FliL protein